MSNSTEEFLEGMPIPTIEESQKSFLKILDEFGGKLLEQNKKAHEIIKEIIAKHD